MTLATSLAEAPRATAIARLARSPLVWIVLALVVIVGRDIGNDPTRVLHSYGDPDDALRIVEIREWMEGRGWFDMTLPRVGAPDALVSHWSRLVDVPLAALIAGAGLFVTPDMAETVARYVWPTIVLGLLLVALVGHMRRSHGDAAAVVALFLAVTSVAALFQFRAGRIDHHGLQILLAAAGLWRLQAAFSDPGKAFGAGALLGLGLAIGLEALGLVGAALVLASLIGAFAPRHIDAVARAAAGFAVALGLAFVATVPPERWGEMACDALGLDLVLLAGAGALAVALAARSAERSTFTRLAILAGGGGLALALYLAARPACLAGPFAGLDPAVFPIWLDKVTETRSSLALFGDKPALAGAFVIFNLVACVSALVVYRRERSIEQLFALGVVWLAVAYGSVQLKVMPYPAWLAIPPVAAALAGLAGWRWVPARTLTMGLAVLVAPATAMIVISGVLQIAPNALGARITPLPSPAKVCADLRLLGELRRLDPGLLLADRDLGSMIVAATPHRVVSAPYHRIDTAIVAQQAILTGAPATSVARLRDLGVDHVALCAATLELHRSGESVGLVHDLALGRPPVGLVAVADPGLTAFKVWRVTPAP